MGITSNVDERGIAEVVMDNPPVNALNVQGWFDLALIVCYLGVRGDLVLVVISSFGLFFF